MFLSELKLSSVTKHKSKQDKTMLWFISNLNL